MRAIAPSMPPHACPREGHRRPTPSSCAAGKVIDFALGAVYGRKYAYRIAHVAVARLVGAECAAGVSSLPAAPPTGLGAVPAQKEASGRGGERKRRRDRHCAAWQNPSSGRAASAPAQAASALSSCATVRTSWYDEVAGRKRGGARRRAMLCGKCRTFGW
jgi:hypothetical protein